MAAAQLGIPTFIVFYIVIGYPVLLAVGSRRLAPAVRKDPQFPAQVTVLMAVYNGEEFISNKLESLLALRYPRELAEILVVFDGSTDSTDSIFTFYADRGVRLLRQDRGGKSAALNVALQHAGGEILFLTDVRQALDRDALSHLVANFADPTVGAVTGELRSLDPHHAGEQADLELYWRYELWVRKRHSGIDSIFDMTGCIYAVRRSRVKPIPPDTLTDDSVIPLRTLLSGYRVIFDPAAIAFDYPTTEGGEFRRKLRTLAGPRQVHARLPQLLTSANHMRFDFLSHKFTRLALPGAMLTIWIATLSLPASSFRNFLLLDELLLVALAMADRFVPRGFPLKRISSPARTFLAMNAGPLLSPVKFIVKPTTMWRPTKVGVRR
jgi:cellulose synthase/poly-beta-1,6-N-acetylglucosamine synthase-like glycosyltransferase